jgi:starvation-inducible outer membrane lipoprotein
MKLTKTLLFSLSLAIAGCQTIPNKAEPLETIIERSIEAPIVDYPEVSIQDYGFEGLDIEELRNIVSQSVIKSGDYVLFDDYY